MTRVEAREPSPAAYASLREAMGWPAVDIDGARAALQGSWWVGIVVEEDQLQGLIRVVGDGVLTFYVADVMVHPRARGQGLGDRLMEAALDRLGAAAAPGATVAVVPLVGQEGFYARHGFVSGQPFGSGMVWRWNTITHRGEDDVEAS